MISPIPTSLILAQFWSGRDILFWAVQCGNYLSHATSGYLKSVKALSFVFYLINLGLNSPLDHSIVDY